MSTFRKIQTAFWQDPKVEEELTPEDKYFFLYLLSNPQTTQIGIYTITKRKMAYELGYSLETVEVLLGRFIHHLEIVKYNPETRELAIKNWGRYNLKRGGKPMLDCITKELSEVKDKDLIAYIGKQIHHEEIRKLYDTYAGKEVSNSSTPPKQEEQEVKENDTSEVKDLFEHFVSKNIIRHKRLTAAMRSAIKARLREYSYDELVKAIDNYAHIYFSDGHWFTHKYPLADFMRDKDIRKFLDEADPIHNFSHKKQVTINRKEVRKEDFDLS